MKILILSWRGPGHPLAGGAEIATLEHAKGWVKAGHQVTLFTSHFSGGKKEEVIEGVRIVRKGGDILGVRMQAFGWYLFGDHPKFDLVVDEFHGIPFFTPFYVRSKKLAFIHEVAKEVWWLNPWPRPINLIPGILGTLFEPLIFKLFYHSVAFMTVSESTKKDLVSWGIPPTRITVVHNGVDTIPTKVQKEKKKTVIFLGALAKDKGIEDALKAFAIMNKKDAGLQFWIVGGGSPDYLKELKRQAKNLAIEKRIKFWGFVENKKKFELLAKSHILLNPSVREGWGLVNIEANASGTPVVGYNVPGIRDSVIDGKTGLLSEYGNYKELAINSMKLFGNENLYKRMQKADILWSRKFSWGSSVKKSLYLLKNLQ